MYNSADLALQTRKRAYLKFVNVDTQISVYSILGAMSIWIRIGEMIVPDRGDLN